MLLAHLTTYQEARIEQSLKEHCEMTAKYAAESLRNVGFYNTAYIAGIMHDMGKATCIFNDYLERAFVEEDADKGSVNHSFAGVIYILEKYHQSKNSMEVLASEVIAYAIGAHHGLFDCVDFDGNNGFLHRLNADKKAICYEEACENYFKHVTTKAHIDELFQKSVKEVEKFYNNTKDLYQNLKTIYFQIGMLARMITSAVIYGDHRDTREFMSQVKDSICENADWKKQHDYLEQSLLQLNNDTQLNQVRSSISQQCLDFADKPTGIYRINVPTGGGKTLSTLRYALAHAEKCNESSEFSKKRIIFIIPLLSVLDQNAKVIRENLADKDMVLEHHSNVVYEEEVQGKFEVLTDTWDSTVIISTVVQLMDMIFAHRTSAIGRMRALCDSIIVIDEVQSLPKKLTEMFNMAMNFLSKTCNATIILSSATQPCFENLDSPLMLSQDCDMVRLDKNQLKAFERADIIDKTTAYGMDFEQMTEFCCSLIEKHSSLLVICNTKKEARDLFKRLSAIAGDNDWKMYHLSTSMCQAHRMDTLEELQDNLKLVQKGKLTSKVVCVSTQVVEAGIDFSWEGVVRVLAGIDNIAQAAGRCNRSNEYGHKGKVYLINIKDEKLSMLKEIKKAQKSTCGVLERKDLLPDEDILGEAAVNRFYRYLFKELGEETKYQFQYKNKNFYMANWLSNSSPGTTEIKNRAFILRQPFKTVAKEFKVFDDDMIDIVVPYKNGKKLIKELKEAEKSSFGIIKLKKLITQAKQYTISVRKYKLEELYNSGQLEVLFEGRIFILDEKSYNDDYGFGEVYNPTVEDFMY